ncbi:MULTISPECIES: hypothetical protein [Sphingobacterium]|uniref:Outer membrane protein beta-barrel domain-containing protein n=1 Tax=Sphingobacterium populi TaxID=1812824 RepID=A0ABW5UAL2_9SPHI|nr:hypothetical protein [Sphingobacterium sp. CFCC 11742]
MYKAFFIVGIFLSICPAANAQFNSLPFEWNVHVGGSYFNAPSFTRMMQEQDLNAISPVGIDVALGIGYRLGRVVAGGNVSRMYGVGRDKKFGATTPTIYVATNLLHIDRWVIVPFLGFGAQFASALIEKEYFTGNFDDFFTNNSNQTRFTHTAPVVDLGITFKTYDLFTATYRAKFKMGYQTGLKQPVWRVGNTELHHAPRDRTSTVYLQLSMGIGR